MIADPTLPETTTVASSAGAGAQPSLRRLMGEIRQRKVATAGLLVFLAILLIALLAPLLAPHEPLKQNLGDNFLPPAWKDGGDWTYPFGTDPLGRDILTRLMYGARSSLIISIGAVFVGLAIGLVTGLVAGFYGGFLDTTLMRLGDIQLAFPFVLFAIAILAVSPNRTVWHLMAVLGISSWVIYARVVRSRVLSERNKDYARAAQAVGASRWRVLRRYVLPNVWQAMVPIALLNLAYFVVVESLLSFIALGLSPPNPSWGSILADGRQYMMVDPWMALLPGFAIVITVLAIGLAADGFADILDPKLTQGAFQRQPLTSSMPDSTIAEESENDLLQVRNVCIDYPAKSGTVHAVRDVSLDVAPAEVVGIVGESGSGKSTLGLAIMQLLDAPGRVTDGALLFEGADLARASNKRMNQIRGRGIGMIFQDPGNSLNPVLTVGYQLAEVIRANRAASGDGIRTLARQSLAAMNIADPDRVLRAYPFQLSGGMQQRVMIALAMIAKPRLLILDEPTSALDVTTQAQLLAELESLRAEHRTSMLFISHDIALLAQIASRIVVMYAGQVIESGPRDTVVANPLHPYTRALIGAVERVDAAGEERLEAIAGDPPDLRIVQPGCPFAPRCPLVMDRCWTVAPPRIAREPGHEVACHLYESPGSKEIAA
ncbi:MAG: dipeptide/oligopeptide/nickel ABC transporter permease/ATP-binding protein [Thermomicrobiales bacterium]|nr:dipeptide/oligopeptide/nickel ABC transporter permease/ATP-binding protein [Thermomicrobiales bacterium]